MRLGWQEADLATRRKSDPAKMAIAGRLRRETTLPVRWLAARVQIGTSKGARAVLFRWANETNNARPLMTTCTQLELKSLV